MCDIDGLGHATSWPQEYQSPGSASRRTLFCIRAAPFSPLQSATIQRSRAISHLMPIVTPRLILRPPTLGDLDSMQSAKQDAWPDLQRRMAWAFDNQRSRQAMEDSIRRTMDYQSQPGIALAGFHRI